jgi:hypothetical protein
MAQVLTAHTQPWAMRAGDWSRYSNDCCRPCQAFQWRCSGAAMVSRQEVGNLPLSAGVLPSFFGPQALWGGALSRFSLQRDILPFLLDGRQFCFAMLAVQPHLSYSSAEWKLKPTEANIIARQDIWYSMRDHT